MDIFSFDEFVVYGVDEARGSLGWIRLNFPIQPRVWGAVTSTISSGDIYKRKDIKGLESGIEKTPHITLLDGIHEDVDDKKVDEIIYNSIYSPRIQLENVSIFENEEFDVVKLDIKSDEIDKMHEALKALPHTSFYTQFLPHVTIGFVKSGKGKKYERMLEKEIIIIYSAPNRNSKVYTVSPRYGLPTGGY